MTPQGAPSPARPINPEESFGGRRSSAPLWCVRMLAGGLLKSLRIDERNTAGLAALLSENRPFVFAFWHGSMMYPWWKLRRHRPACLVSQSKDGQILSEILHGWGYRLIRGSSSKGSAEAMESMRQAIREGHILSITPDGPRGPRHAFKMGAVRAAQTTGVPLVLCAVGYGMCRRLRSWDRFEIPMPFSRVSVEYSAPLWIPPEASGEDLERIRQDVENDLRRMYARLNAGSES